MSKTMRCRHCGGSFTLTSEERVLAEARFMEGVSVLEIARELRVTRKTIYDALDHLRHPEEPGQGRLFGPEEVSRPEGQPRQPSNDELWRARGGWVA